MSFVKRPYQWNLTGDILMAFAQGHRRVLAVLPTGGGKTVIFDDMLLEWPGPALAVAHRKELIRQASKKLGDVPHGIIAPWSRPNRERIQIGSIQTLARRSIGKQSFIVADEAHHSVAGTWKRFLDSQPDAFILGVTATPERLDGRGLGDMYDCMIVGPSVAELIEGGYLKPWRGFAPPTNVDFAAMRTLGGDYNQADVVKAMDKADLIGDAVAHYAKLTPGQPALAFCASVGAAEHEAEGFRARGWKFVCVHGGLEDNDREDRLAGFAEGYYDGLTSCDLISEGLDIPAVSVVILRRPTQSLGRYMQMVGRGFRIGGADILTILDHAGNMHRHGLPDDPREWSLEGRKKKQTTRPSVRSCPACYAMHRPAPACPACGYEYPKSEIHKLTAAEGDLIEIARRGARPPPDSGLTLVEELKGVSTFDEVDAIRIRRGYRPGWTNHIMRTKRLALRAPPRTAAEDFAAFVGR